MDSGTDLTYAIHEHNHAQPFIPIFFYATHNFLAQSYTHSAALRQFLISCYCLCGATFCLTSWDVASSLVASWFYLVRNIGQYLLSMVRFLLIVWFATACAFPPFGRFTRVVFSFSLSNKHFSNFALYFIWFKLYRLSLSLNVRNM